jgi:ribosomal protein S18 acetylase RimI-like enzyme
VDRSEQFRSLFRFQTEENFQPPGSEPRPEDYRREDIPQHFHRQGFERKTGQGYLFSSRSDEDRDWMADRRYKQAWGEHNSAMATHGWAQGQLEKRIFDTPLDKPEPLENWARPEHVSQHGDYDIGSFPGGMVAFHGSTPVARMHLTKSNRQGYRSINLIETAPEHRRRGLATAMWHQAQAIHGGSIVHSPKRTAQGEHWARSVGGNEFSMSGSHVVPMYQLSLEQMGMGEK